MRVAADNRFSSNSPGNIQPQLLTPNGSVQAQNQPEAYHVVVSNPNPIKGNAMVSLKQILQQHLIAEPAGFQQYTLGAQENKRNRIPYNNQGQGNMAQSASEKIELPKSFRDDDGLSEGVPTNRLTNCANKKRKRIFEDYPDTARMMRVVAGQASTLNLSQNKKLLTSYQDIKPQFSLQNQLKPPLIATGPSEQQKPFGVLEQPQLTRSPPLTSSPLKSPPLASPQVQHLQPVAQKDIRDSLSELLPRLLHRLESAETNIELLNIQLRRRQQQDAKREKNMLSLIGSKERELLQKEAEIMRYQAREKVTSLRQCQQDARLSRLERELKASMRIQELTIQNERLYRQLLRKSVRANKEEHHADIPIHLLSNDQWTSTSSYEQGLHSHRRHCKHQGIRSWC